MIKTHTISIYISTKQKSAEGIAYNSYILSGDIFADVQPAGLTQAQLQLYGIGTKDADARKVFCDYDSRLKIGGRVTVDGAAWFEIRALNTWPSHQEMILTPLQGTAPVVTFAASGVSVPPLPAAVYTSAQSWIVASATLTGSAPNKSGVMVSGASTINPAATAGTLYKISGTGDAIIAYSSFTTIGGVVTFVVSGVTTTPTANAIYTDNALFATYEWTVASTSLVAGAGAIVTTATIIVPPIPSGLLTKVSGTGDTKIIFTGWSA